MVYLIGAGPGDPGLITVKGLEFIKQCDTIIYDRLGTYQLLEMVKPDCRRIYVGKQAGSHYKKQPEINEILVEEGRKGNMVVRLKGGDPFVFGRGGEEVTALLEAGIPFQVIPGITSSGGSRGVRHTGDPPRNEQKLSRDNRTQAGRHTQIR